MVTMTVFQWTKVTKAFNHNNYQRTFNTAYRFCFACILILVILQFENAQYSTNVWVQTSRLRLPFQQLLRTDKSIESLNADLNKMVKSLVDLKAGVAARSNASVIEETEDQLKPAAEAMDSGSSPMLVLFSSWEYSREKFRVHKKVMLLWGSWNTSVVRPVIYSSNATERSVARSAGWDARPVTKTNRACHGPPVLSALFTDAFENFRAFLYGYSNADIVFGEGLVKTLKFIQSNNIWHSKPVLIVGRRYNFDFLQYKVPLDNPHDVISIARLGKLVLRSTDYFFTNILFPWQTLAPVTIGRPFVVRTVIGFAIKKRIDIIDATQTIEAVHLTTRDGVFSSWHKPGVQCNRQALKKASYKIPLKLGHCECARLETHSDKKGHISLRSRDPNPDICGE